MIFFFLIPPLFVGIPRTSYPFCPYFSSFHVLAPHPEDSQIAVTSSAILTVIDP